MNKNDYLKRLERALKNISKEERQRTLSYYSELIDDRIEEGIPEAQAVSGLETPEAVASRILAETGAQPAKKGLGAGAIVAIVLSSLLLLFLIIYPLFILPAMVTSGIQEPNSQSTVMPIDPDSTDPGQSATDGRQVTTELNYDAGTNFDLNLVSSSIDIRPSKDGRCHLSYTSDDAIWYNISISGDTVSIEEDSEGNLINWGAVSDFFSGKKSGGRKVTLLIPTEATSEVTSSSVSGSAAADSLSFDRLRLESVSGNIDITNVDCSLKLEAYSVSGRLKLTGCSAPDGRFDSTSGSVYLSNCSIASLSCDTVSGDCELRNTEFDSISFDTVSGDLEGDLMGSPEDYSVFFSTTSGDNSLSFLRTRGQKTIEFSSVSGDLDLEFPGLSYDD